jgi:hypothetical protein
MSSPFNINKIFEILSDPHFLAMEGLGNEVPYFVYAYDIKNQEAVYSGIGHLKKKLENSGTSVLQISLYSMILEILKEQDYMEQIFEFEKESTKSDFFDQLRNLLTKEEITNYIKKKLSEEDYQLLFFDQVGEVYPYLRTHDLLNWIQSTITDIPVITFFPGDYVMSPKIGFNLNLFGKLSGPYYRAFRLDEYMLRRQNNG